MRLLWKQSAKTALESLKRLILMQLQIIGHIETAFTSIENMPIQPKGNAEGLAKVIVDERLVDGLKDLEGFSHIYLIYCFHEAKRDALSVVPFMDSVERGVYATRSPLRPNHMGLSIVEVLGIEKNVITIKGADVLDGTPLLDIKPYIEAFDKVESSRSGWMQQSSDAVTQKRSDDRFA
jgi:tRNA-Thr(GGU) m(6)t(6)A37 methyltransferase TsaA